MTPVLLPGFSEPVEQAQACFRATLDAMARPGRIHQVRGPSAPFPLAPATAAVLLTLLDQDTPTWLDESFVPAGAWLAFHCGISMVAAPQAAFLVASGLPSLDLLRSGTDAEPEDSATVILQIDDLGCGPALRLSGPGLRKPTHLAVTGLPDDFISRWRANHALFPRGVDLILCAGDRIAALPRSVEIT
jgi:alpha-D-ribose 1-methylphosphonate 5-triphosphate synthase subunit PhnH